MINKFSITDTNELNIIEREYSTMRDFHINDQPPKGTFDIKHLQGIHHFLFQDIYKWAGKFRTVDISKGNTLFCRYSFIEPYLKDLFLKLEKQNYLINRKPDSFTESLAFYFGELNGVHPFREGNGRSQRIFFKLLSRMAGYELDFQKVTAEQMLEASIHSMMTDNSKFEEMLERITLPLSKTEQLKYAQEILPPNHKVLSLLKETTSVIEKITETKKAIATNKTKKHKQNKEDFTR